MSIICRMQVQRAALAVGNIERTVLPCPEQENSVCRAVKVHDYQIFVIHPLIFFLANMSGPAGKDRRGRTLPLRVNSLDTGSQRQVVSICDVEILHPGCFAHSQFRKSVCRFIDAKKLVNSKHLSSIVYSHVSSPSSYA